MNTIDLTLDEIADFDDGTATHLPTVRMAREIRRRRAAEHVPPAIAAGLYRYQQGIEPGSCLRCILEGDLFGAFARADPDTAAAMRAIVDRITSTLPSATYGSPEAVSRFLEQSRQALADARKGDIL